MGRTERGERESKNCRKMEMGRGERGIECAPLIHESMGAGKKLGVVHSSTDFTRMV